MERIILRKTFAGKYIVSVKRASWSDADVFFSALFFTSFVKDAIWNRSFYLLGEECKHVAVCWCMAVVSDIGIVLLGEKLLETGENFQSSGLGESNRFSNTSLTPILFLDNGQCRRSSLGGFNGFWIGDLEFVGGEQKIGNIGRKENGGGWRIRDRLEHDPNIAGNLQF